jgi:hypothetical protein
MNEYILSKIRLDNKVNLAIAKEEWNTIIKKYISIAKKGLI